MNCNRWASTYKYEIDRIKEVDDGRCICITAEIVDACVLHVIYIPIYTHCFGQVFYSGYDTSDLARFRLHFTGICVRKSSILEHGKSCGDTSGFSPNPDPVAFKSSMSFKNLLSFRILGCWMTIDATT